MDLESVMLRERSQAHKAIEYVVLPTGKWTEDKADLFLVTRGWEGGED
jgi:hypothetical protein